MSTNEQHRHQLRTDLQRVLSEKSVNTLMTSLPPFDWDQMVTKTDLHDLEARLDTKIERLEVRLFSRLHREMVVSTRWTVGTIIVAFGAFAALIGLFG